MARANLSNLLGNVGSDPEPPKAQPKSPAEPKPATPATATAKTEGTRAEAHYLTYLRKEARLREDQVTALATHARRLNRESTGDERITENTLIRIAVDLLLDRTEKRAGSTEDELRNSVSL